MYSLEEGFKELLGKIQDPATLNPAKSDPIFYFAYPTGMMLELKKALPRLTAKIKQLEFEPVRVSMAELLWEAVEASGRWESWLEVEPHYDRGEINEAVRDVLRKSGGIVDRVYARIQSASERAVVLITETELLHPYFRTRAVESALHDKVTTPTVIFYPGRRSGQYGLHFLDFYTVDGNYRSTLIGGL